MEADKQQMDTVKKLLVQETESCKSGNYQN